MKEVLSILGEPLSVSILDTNRNFIEPVDQKFVDSSLDTSSAPPHASFFHWEYSKQEDQHKNYKVRSVTFDKNGRVYSLG